MNFKEKNVMNNDYQITSTTGIKIEGYHSIDLFLYFLNQLFSKYTYRVSQLRLSSLISRLFANGFL
jgi:hypothetical protein